MADALELKIDLAAPLRTQPVYDFRTDPGLIPRAKMIAGSLMAGRNLTHGDEHTLARAVIRLDEEAARAAEMLECSHILLVVEGRVERDMLQLAIDPKRRKVQVIVPFDNTHLHGRRFGTIAIRYPTAEWFRATKTETHVFQEWEREHLYPRLIKGGNFQHI